MPRNAPIRERHGGECIKSIERTERTERTERIERTERGMSRADACQVHGHRSRTRSRG